MKFTISNAEIQIINNGEIVNFPKYTSQLINWANQNAQGTRPKVVGQMSDLFLQFTKETTDILMDTWRKWYIEKYPTAIDEATDKIYLQVQNLKNAIPLIDKTLVKKWVEDLVITKTFNGMYFQKAILSKIAELKSIKDYRLATPQEESKGIDGFVGSRSYSIKAYTYKTMKRLSEQINVKMVYYTKTKTGLKIEVED
jgi:hypothetical protein